MRTDENISFDEDISRAVACIRAGGVVLYPTDTIWGLGCDARCSEAVRRIYAIKRRAESKALITLVDSPEMLGRYVKHVPEAVGQIIGDRHADGDNRPTTMVLDNAINLAPEITAADGSAGFRITREAYSSALCALTGGPIVSTSANISGHPAPAIFSEISPDIIALCDYTACFRRNDTSRSLPSKVVKISADGAITVIRP